MKKRIIISISLIALSVFLVLGFFAFNDWRENMEKQAFLEAIQTQRENDYRDALRAYTKGDYDRAVKLFLRSGLPKSKRMLVLARRKAAEKHVILAEKFKKQNKFNEAAKEYALAIMNDPSSKRLRDLADSNTIKREVDETINRIAEAEADSDNQRYKRDDVASYNITKVQKKGHEAKVWGTATMKDGKVLSGCSNLVKIEGKWKVVDYSY